MLGCILALLYVDVDFSENAFIAMTNFVAREADASILIGGVTIVTIVEIHSTRLIAAVRLFENEVLPTVSHCKKLQ